MLRQKQLKTHTRKMKQEFFQTAQGVAAWSPRLPLAPLPLLPSNTTPPLACPALFLHIVRFPQLLALL